jgi:hypothetical protein
MHEGEKGVVWLPSLRRHYPDQVLRVSSQPLRHWRNSTPRNLKNGYKDTRKFRGWVCNFWKDLAVQRKRMQHLLHGAVFKKNC